MSTEGEPAARHAALGDALNRRVDEISRAILATWEQRCPEPAAHADERVKDDILRTTEIATMAVVSYLRNGEAQSAEQKRATAATGKAPLRETISLTDLTKLYLYWRDATIAVVHEEALRLGFDERSAQDALDLVRAGSDGSVVRMVKQFDSERQKLQRALAREQARLAHEALHDPLTRLPNRRLFFDRLTHALAFRKRRKVATAVLFIDIDKFKAVNDRHGHSCGDQLLIAVAQRVKDAVRSTDTVARLGGDEFVVLCEDLIAPDDETKVLLARVQDAFTRAFTVAGVAVDVSASIGLAVASAEHDLDADDLLTRADHAMYQAKQREREPITRETTHASGDGD